jgi:LmbE family N-acetylglucosaminyl deacetylase
MHFSRRTALAGAGSLLASALASPAAARRKLVVFGAHPDDPESGAGGTMARFAAAGHDVVALYLTRGERGITGKSLDEAAAIRTREAEAACRILGARPLFAGQIDGDTEINRARYAAFQQLLLAEAPDILLTQWPIDTHRDHRLTALLAHDAWLASKRKFELYYYEVESGHQTQNFPASCFVDISATLEKKRAACFAHASQNPEGFWRLHDQMNRFRGMEAGCPAAEAFLPFSRSISIPI